MRIIDKYADKIFALCKKAISKGIDISYVSGGLHISVYLYKDDICTSFNLYEFVDDKENRYEYSRLNYIIEHW